jgi:EAL domain-containing protein (putative c-di-GMP-specific phosphodiesterase class I)
VIWQACREAASWPKPVKVAVNLSGVQFRSKNLLPTIVQALAESGLAPERLELEITESVLLEDSEATIEFLHRLKALGVSISMDDFGTGFSSLSYLRSFPFDKLKIDQSFVRDLDRSTDSLAIVQSIVTLGSNLDMLTTAEGVETCDQLDKLRAIGCAEAQGFYFARPLPVEQIPALNAPQGLTHAA